MEGYAPSYLTEDVAIFRDAVRRFCERECAPHLERWIEQGMVDRELWNKAGEAGLLCASMPEEYGGGGGSFAHEAVLIDELMRINNTGWGITLHNGIVAPYISHYGSEEQKRRWLPRMASGEIVGAIAMTEPGAGSDLQGVRTTARRDGNEYVINGQKVFITNGQQADLIIVVAKTGPAQGAKGISLLVVEADMEGFRRGRNLRKVGLKAQDTSELFFDDVRVPTANLLGDEEGRGFVQLMQQLPQERLIIGLQSVAGLEAALEQTIEYTKQRKQFGKPILDFQNTRFRLAEGKTVATVARVFADKCVELHLEGKLDAITAAMIKWWASEEQNKFIDEFLQLHGGYGYMLEYPISRMWTDARVQRIYGGTNEIMREIIARTL
jgi:acyl-CoA dehydrogenase